MHAEIELDDRAGHHRRAWNEPVDGLDNVVAVAGKDWRSAQDRIALAFALQGASMRGSPARTSA